ncbi:plasmid replication protein RepC [Ancylobacter defluvii]|uniref:plasmid replication protein RepC n=1 Tax=Ancylobacter defluvii TaxID=1282440 RepID=UPI001BCABE2E|nr:plasmid replication protein RepC [Ancylobacter defluvii]MBS7590119.1 replication initiation protein RepC [Ancylobacter defluvii]
MTELVATTPFGRRPMTLGQISSQLRAKAVATDAVAHKWQVFHDIRNARELLGATDRALAILEALLTFHPETALTPDSGLVVFPSNEHLISRANGMSPATLRRHLAVLVQCGLVIRRDSPNGKRYARKGRGGEIEQAYGFDLTPILARAAEFKDLANAVEAEKKAFKRVKEKLTICRRDIVKMIDAGIGEGVPADWRRFRREYETIIGRLPRTAPRQVLETIAQALEALWLDINSVLESFVKSEDSNANESHSERHKQNSNPDSIYEIEQAFRKDEEASGSVAETDNLRSLPKRDLPLGMVLSACPDVVDYAKGREIRTWRDFFAAAEQARPALGISPSAWMEAQEAMGAENAAITVAAILQRAERISSGGGYLRNLVERARDGKFTVWPMVMALLRAKIEESKLSARASGAGGGDVARPDDSSAGGNSSWTVSPALLKSLEKPRRP